MGDTNSTSRCDYYNTTLMLGGDVRADPDATGNAMLTAFFATATISIAAVLSAYLFGALEESRQNFLDARVLLHCQSFWYKIFPHRRERMNSWASTVSIQKIRNYRKEGLTQFILALSDQQLVTGIAILLAALLNLKLFNRFDVTMIHSLAWFSATTHLATLDPLSHYLASHRIVRAIRTAAIVFFMSLLTSVFVIRAIMAMEGLKMGSPAMCIITNVSPFISEYSNWYGPFYRAWQASWILALLLVLVGYLVRLQDLHLDQRSPFYLVGWIAWVARSFKMRYQPYSQLYKENKAALWYERIVWFSGSNGQKRWLPFGYDDSYLSSIPDILFSFSYGVAQLASVKWDMKILNFIGDDKQLRFGQIVALLLLCLPFMAAGAAISDYKQRQSKHLEHDKRDTELFPGFQEPLELEPCLSHRSEIEDMEFIEARYQNKMSHINRYFFKQAQQIAQQEAKADRVRITQLKRSVLSGLTVVEQVEDNIAIVPHVVWFGIQACGALITGALLNAASFDAASQQDKRTVWVAIGILIAYITGKAVALTYETQAIIRLKA